MPGKGLNGGSIDPADSGLDAAAIGEKGKSFILRLDKGFPNSPINRITKAQIKQTFQDCLTGTQTENEMFNSDGESGVSMDYADAPTLDPENPATSDVTLAQAPTAHEGHPASPFFPNLSSPGGTVGQTNVNVSSLTSVTPSNIAITPNTFGSGEGTFLDPKTSSTNIGAQKFDELVMGKSS